MSTGSARFLLAPALLLAGGCTSSKPAKQSAESTSVSFDPGGAVPVVKAASVVAFWLGQADTIPEAVRNAARETFRRSNAMVARYLSDTDIALVATVNDTLVIQLAGGTRRVVMLSGLDFPYGYLLIEPGYAEEFHTGVSADEDLQDAIDDYFGLESDTPRPKHRIAHHAGRRATLVSK